MTGTAQTATNGTKRMANHRSSAEACLREASWAELAEDVTAQIQLLQRASEEIGLELREILMRQCAIVLDEDVDLRDPRCEHCNGTPAIGTKDECQWCERAGLKPASTQHFGAK